MRVFIGNTQTYRFSPPLFYLPSLRGIDLRYEIEGFRRIPRLADRLDHRAVPPIDAAGRVGAPNHGRHRIIGIS
jgi:hypothetical protein